MARRKIKQKQKPRRKGRGGTPGVRPEKYRYDEIHKAPNASKLTAQVAETICNALRLSTPIEFAANAAGVRAWAVGGWLRRGHAAIAALERGDKRVPPGEFPYIHFADAVKQAIADAVLISMRRIDTAGRNGAWQAEAWKLERRHPKEYGKREYKDITSKGKRISTVAPEEALTEDGKRALEARIFARLGAFARQANQNGETDGSTPAPR